MLPLFGRGEKLKQDIINYILENKIVNTVDVAKEFNISFKKAEKILVEIEEKGLLNGFYDDDKKRFVLIDRKLISDMLNKIRSSGLVVFSEMGSMYNVPEAYVKEVVSAALTKKFLKGFYMKNMAGFVTADHLRKIILDKAINSGQFYISELELELNLDQALLREAVRRMIDEGELRGVLHGNIFVSIEKLSDEILNVVMSRNSISIKDLAKLYGVSTGIIYMALRRLEASKLVDLILDPMAGDYIVFNRRIANRIVGSLNASGKVNVQEIAKEFNAPIYLIRGVVEKLSSEYGLVGVWSVDGVEYLTAESVYGKIKDDLDKETPLLDIARKLDMPLPTVRYLLDKMIEKKLVNGIILDGGSVFVPAKGKDLLDLRYDYYSRKSDVEAEKLKALPEVISDLFYRESHLTYVLTIKNFTDQSMTDISVSLDIPEHGRVVSFSPDSISFKGNIANIPYIKPFNYVTVELTIDILKCSPFKVSGIITYKDSMGRWNSIVIEEKSIDVECPDVVEVEEVTPAYLREVMERAKQSDFKRFILTLDGAKAFSIIDDSLGNLGFYKVSEIDLSEDDLFIKEGWYYALVGKKKEKVVVKTLVDESRNLFDITVSCDSGALLNGILSKISETVMKRITVEEQKEVFIATGNVRMIQCSCGAPLPKLPTDNEPVKCEYCGTIWHIEDVASR